MRLMISFPEWRDFKICQRLWWWKWGKNLVSIQALLFSNEAPKMTIHFFHQNPGLELPEILKYYKTFQQTLNLNLIPHSDFPLIRQFAFQEKEGQDKELIERYITYFKKMNFNFTPPELVQARIPAGKSSSHTFFSVSYEGIIDNWVLNPFWGSELALNPGADKGLLDNIRIIILEENLGRKLEGFLNVDLEGLPITQSFDIAQRGGGLSPSSLYQDVLALRDIKYGKKVKFPKERCRQKNCPYQILCNLKSIRVDTGPIEEVAFIKKSEIWEKTK